MSAIDTLACVWHSLLTTGTEQQVIVKQNIAIEVKKVNGMKILTKRLSLRLLLQATEKKNVKQFV